MNKEFLTEIKKKPKYYYIRNIPKKFNGKKLKKNKEKKKFECDTLTQFYSVVLANTHLHTH